MAMVAQMYGNGRPDNNKQQTTTTNGSYCQVVGQYIANMIGIGCPDDWHWLPISLAIVAYSRMAMVAQMLAMVVHMAMIARMAMVAQMNSTRLPR